LDPELEVNRALGTVIENVRIPVQENLGYYELKKHMP
jgi:hypothetical protein